MQVKTVKIVIDSKANDIKTRALGMGFTNENFANVKKVFITRPKVMDEAICNTLYFNFSTTMNSLSFLALR